MPTKHLPKYGNAELMETGDGEKISAVCFCICWCVSCKVGHEYVKNVKYAYCALFAGVAAQKMTPFSYYFAFNFRAASVFPLKQSIPQPRPH